MTLDYLDFDYSEDAHGHGSFEAMASVPTARLPALQAEMERVLDWAFATFPDQRGPLEEGGEWDYLLEGQQEWSVPDVMVYDEATRRFSSRSGTPGPTRYTVTLALSGSAQFCAALRQHFGL